MSNLLFLKQKEQPKNCSHTSFIPSYCMCIHMPKHVYTSYYTHCFGMFHSVRYTKLGKLSHNKIILILNDVYNIMLCLLHCSVFILADHFFCLIYFVFIFFFSLWYRRSNRRLQTEVLASQILIQQCRAAQQPRVLLLLSQK